MFITNPVSGGGLHREIEKLIRRNIHFRFDYTLEHSRYAGHAKELARQAAAEKVDAVIAVGGDGSAHEIGCELVNSQTALGIIPSGSGNGIARSLGVPVDVEESIECINQWHHTTIDTAQVNQKPFLGIGGLGFEALISREFHELHNRGFINYVKLIASRFLDFKPLQVSLQIDSAEPVSMEIFTLACANTTQYGNSACIAPEANTTDGVLNITAIQPFPHLKAPLIASRLFNNTIHKSPFVKSFSGRKIRIETENPLMHLDGEPLLMENPLEFSVVPLSLNVIVPKAETDFEG